MGLVVAFGVNYRYQKTRPSLRNRWERVSTRESPDLTNLPSCTILVRQPGDWNKFRVENAFIIDRV